MDLSRKTGQPSVIRISSIVFDIGICFIDELTVFLNGGNFFQGLSYSQLRSA